MNQQSKNQQVGDVIKVYAAWKASQRHSPQQSPLISKKLNPKFRIMKQVSQRTQSSLHKDRECKSKNARVNSQVAKIEQSPQTTKTQHFSIKKERTTSSLFTRFKSLELHRSPPKIGEKIIKLKFKQENSLHDQKQVEGPKKSSKHLRTVSIPVSMKSKFSDKSTSPGKILTWRQFCFSDYKEKTNFINNMINSDLQVLSNRCKVDMDPFLFKIHKQECMRKIRALNCWQNFNYEQLQE